jgi:hypothetical protein
MRFSMPPQASELRSWAEARGFRLQPRTEERSDTPETWVNGDGRWRLKMKHAGTRPELHPASRQERFSCREINPVSGNLEYYNPCTEEFGTRRSMGHLPIDID